MDDIKFENRYDITKGFIRSEYKLSQKRSGKLNLWLVFVMKIVYILVLIAYIILGGPLISTFTFFLFFLVCFFVVYPSFIAPARKLRAYGKIAAEKKPFTLPTRNVRFGENIVLQTGISSLSYSYDKVRYIENSDDIIYFWIGMEMVVPLYKNSFTVGNPDDFLAFFREKCSEQEPLWSKGELTRRTIKDMTSTIIFEAVIIACLLFYMVRSL